MQESRAVDCLVDKQIDHVIAGVPLMRGNASAEAHLSCSHTAGKAEALLEDVAGNPEPIKAGRRSTSRIDIASLPALAARAAAHYLPRN